MTREGGDRHKGDSRGKTSALVLVSESPVTSQRTETRYEKRIEISLRGFARIFIKSTHFGSAKSTQIFVVIIRLESDLGVIRFPIDALVFSKLKIERKSLM